MVGDKVVLEPSMWWWLCAPTLHQLSPMISFNLVIQLMLQCCCWAFFNIKKLVLCQWVCVAAVEVVNVGTAKVPFIGVGWWFVQPGLQAMVKQHPA